jgi:hypothetical protein
MSFEDKEQYEKDAIYSEEYESYKNGNIREFKDFLHKLKGEDVFNFIKWLQLEGLKI